MPAHGARPGGRRADRRAARDPRPALPPRVRDWALRGRVPEPAGRRSRPVPGRRPPPRAGARFRARAARSRADPLARERYLLYACVSRATERVTFSYRSSDEDGNVVIAVAVPGRHRRAVRAGWREQRRRRLLADVVWSPDEAPTDARAGGRPQRSRRRPAGRHARTPTRRTGDADALRAGARPRPPPPDRLGRRARDVRRLPGELAGRAPARARATSSPTPSRSYAAPSSTPCSSGCSRGSADRSPRRRCRAEELLHEEMRGRDAADRTRLALARRPRSAPRSCAGSRPTCGAICAMRPPTAATGRRSDRAALRARRDDEGACRR